MAVKSRSFVRNSAPAGQTYAAGTKLSANGVSLMSTGFAGLDKVIGGGIPIGGIVMIMEDIEAPHHLLLLRYFMAQGLVHKHPLLYASPLASPQAFFGTLPNIAQIKESKLESERSPKYTEVGENLRIAWQYRKYFNEKQSAESHRFQQSELTSFSRIAKSNPLSAGNTNDFCSNFDLRKPMERSMLNTSKVECVSLQAISDLTVIKEKCSSFLSKFPRVQGGVSEVGRIAIQSLCAPQCRHSDGDWEMLLFLKTLRAMLRASNAVAMITFPSSLLSPSFCTRWQHLADIVLSVKAIPDDDKELATMLTDYQDMLGFVHIHKLACINTQVPIVLEANTYSLKLLRKRTVVLERLNQAPVDASSGESYGTVSTAALCSRSNTGSALDF
ncbi:elongator complex protein 4 isoform X1 [Cryptomeria japonica]|uniref:elongator complex protein 4 isoform X1 n=1 Tax=Cryptomeria japonica TaxID=3369 RepID=UPI0025AC5E29|nr:elongator complex protein 4 isoform X1 [Cryptomeria japonica]XP_057815595.1 elongator complex protein 4 isoform X1 [Cryptomeria japonica]